jgi:hypothetical protein
VHHGFEAEVRARHARKAPVWVYLNGTRRNHHDEADDLDP